MTLPKFTGKCPGCKRQEPMGVHYDDCPLLDEDDLINPRAWANTSKDNDRHALTLDQWIKRRN